MAVLYTNITELALGTCLLVSSKCSRDVYQTNSTKIAGDRGYRHGGEQR